MRTLLLFLTVAAPAVAQQKRLAVLQFEVQKGLDLDRQTFSQELQNAARRSAPGLFVMTQANIEMLVRAAGKTLDQCEGQCAVETGKLIGADLVLSGRISRVGHTFALSMQVYDTASGELLDGENVRAKSEDDLLEKSAAASGQLVKRLSASITHPEPARSEEAASKPAEPRAAEATTEHAGLRFVSIPGGTFNYQGKGQVTVESFRVGETDVTVEAYGLCVKAGVCSEAGLTNAACNWKTERTKHPINCVDWNQAVAFCHYIGGRLPTQEEWEYVAAGGSEERTYPWGSEPPGAKQCWDGEGNDLGRGNRKGTCPVGSNKDSYSRWGVHDLSDNVWQWTSSDYDDTHKIIRGGAWTDTNPENLRVRWSSYLKPIYGDNINVGFRCVL